MFKLKFGTLPGHWGLKGKTREIAKAEYELEGFDLDNRLLEINKEDFTDQQYVHKQHDISLKHGKITRIEYDRSLVSLIKDDIQRQLANLDLDLKEGLVGESEFDKKSATIKKEPWVTVLEMDFNGKNSLEGSFELDWNEFFVDKLKDEGYVGPTPDAIVNQWFMSVCKNVAMEEFDGTGDFAADAEANLETMKRWNSERAPTGKKIHR